MATIFDGSRFTVIGSFGATSTIVENAGNGRLNLLLKVMSAANLKLVVIDHPKAHEKPSLISKRLSRAFKSEEVISIINLLSEILRAQDNVVTFAKKANLPRGTLYRSFTAPNVPTFRIILSYLNALDLRFQITDRNRTAQR